MGRHGIGILGGSFDPIHIGHLILAEEVLERCCLKRMMFIPSAVPPHKSHRAMAPAEARAEMVSLAIAGHPSFELSRIELDRPGTSYTVETLEALSREAGDDSDLHLVIGADSAVEMSTWCNPERMMDLASVAVVDRPGWDRSAVDPGLAARMRFLDTPLLDISSTDIRRRVKEGRSVRYLLPDRVAAFIEAHGLYR
jgi:nicotinate-nucleotide adenylyltransferase